MLVASVRSSITLAALAQTHAVLEERAEALSAAREALALSLVAATSADEAPHVADPTSGRLAVEIMLRFGEARDPYYALSNVALPQSLRLTLATLSVELGRYEVAMQALEGQEGAIEESFRGFLLAVQGEHQKAIRASAAPCAKRPMTQMLQ